MTIERLAEGPQLRCSLPRVIGFALFSLLAVNLRPAEIGPAAAAKGDANQLAREVIRNEVAAEASDPSLWRYRLMQEKGGQAKVFEVCETKEGEIQRLVALNGRPLTAKQRQSEDERIRKLIANPDELRREAQKQREDSQQAMDLLKIFPDAFRFQLAGMQGNLTRLKFTPNPNFHPSGHAAQVFHNMEGSLLVDQKQKRLVDINGRLATEVKFGGGLLGHLDQGGTFRVRRQELEPGQWQITLMDVQMNGKALFFKTIGVREKDIYTNFRRLPEGTNPQRAAALLSNNEAQISQASHK